MPAEVWVVGVLLAGNCRRVVPFSQQTKWINGVGQTSHVQHRPRFPFSELFSTLCQRHSLFGKLQGLVYDILPPTVNSRRQRGVVDSEFSPAEECC